MKRSVNLPGCDPEPPKAAPLHSRESAKRLLDVLDKAGLCTWVSPEATEEDIEYLIGFYTRITTENPRVDTVITGAYSQRKSR